MTFFRVGSSHGSFDHPSLPSLLLLCVRRSFLRVPSAFLRLSHDRPNWYSPSFSITTFLKISGYFLLKNVNYAPNNPRRTCCATNRKVAGSIPAGKSVSLQAWTGPEGSRKLRFPDFVTKAQNGGKVVSLTHRPPLPPGNAPGTHFC